LPAHPFRRATGGKADLTVVLAFDVDDHEQERCCRRVDEFLAVPSSGSGAEAHEVGSVDGGRPKTGVKVSPLLAIGPSDVIIYLMR